MTILRSALVVIVAAVVGALACSAVMKLMSGEFHPGLAGAIGGASGAVAVVATSSGKKKQTD